MAMSVSTKIFLKYEKIGGAPTLGPKITYLGVGKFQV